MNKIDVKKIYDSMCVSNTLRVNKLPVKPEYTCFIVANHKGKFDPASERYVSLKEETAKACGVKMNIERHTVSTFKKRMKNIDDLSRVMLQLPCSESVLNLFNEVLENNRDKLIDVDHLGDDVYDDMSAGIFGKIPATPFGILAILVEEFGNIAPKKIAVVGNRSKTTGRYLMKILAYLGADVVGYNSQTPINENEFEDFDAVVSCVGSPRLLNIKHCSGRKKVLIDVGVSIVDGKAVGDFNEDVREYHRYTPYTSGVGLLTRSFLVSNVIDTY